MRLTRDFYRPKAKHFPDLRVKPIEDIPGSEIYTMTVRDKPAACVFGGKRSKPDLYYTYPSVEARDAAVARWIEGQRQHQVLVKKTRDQRNTPHGFKPGQIFVASWGYDQTNIDYYLLTKLKGATMGYVVPIGQKTVESSRGADYVAPDPDYIREYDVLLGINESDAGRGKWKKLTQYGFSLGHTNAGACSENTKRYQTALGWGH